MSRRRDFDRRVAAFGEMRGILDAMRNLAVLETRKIERFLSAQQRCVASLEVAASEVSRFHAPAATGEPLPVYLVIGSERGFCGDFNEALERSLAAYRDEHREAAPLVAVGSRLAARLAHDPSLALSLPGPSVAEDVEPILAEVAEGLSRMIRREGRRDPRLVAFAHDPDAGAVRVAALDPIARQARPGTRGSPPRLNVPPAMLLAELAERHLLARLLSLLYGSLLAESSRRLRHLDGAVRRLDEEVNRLRTRRNLLRQEEITEEIEVIMLSAEGPAGNGP